MASRKRVYDAEFAEGAVRMVTETGKSIPEVAEERGVHLGTAQLGVAGQAQSLADVRPTGASRAGAASQRTDR